MGCGKSSRGKLLAKKMNLEFIDLDDYIADQEGLSIEEIFQKHGESTFRKLENQYIKDLSENSGFVMATGGGTASYSDNMEFMNSTGVSLYLKLDNKSLFHRLKNSSSARPLIKNMTDIELFEFIENKTKEREVFYNKANLTINALNFNAKEVGLLLQLYQSEILNNPNNTCN